jgi:hypothetical protein
MCAKKMPRGSYEFYLIQPMAENPFFSSSSSLSQAGFLELCARNKNEKQNEGDERM